MFTKIKSDLKNLAETPVPLGKAALVTVCLMALTYAKAVSQPRIARIVVSLLVEKLIE